MKRRGHACGKGWCTMIVQAFICATCAIPHKKRLPVYAFETIQILPCLSVCIFLQQQLEAERLERNTIANEMLRHGFDLRSGEQVVIRIWGRRLLTQCRRRLCNMADVPSMTHKMAIVRKNHRKNAPTTKMTPTTPVCAKALFKVIFHNTRESC